MKKLSVWKRKWEFSPFSPLFIKLTWISELCSTSVVTFPFSEPSFPFLWLLQNIVAPEQTKQKETGSSHGWCDGSSVTSSSVAEVIVLTEGPRGKMQSRTAQLNRLCSGHPFFSAWLPCPVATVSRFSLETILPLYFWWSDRSGWNQDAIFLFPITQSCWKLSGSLEQSLRIRPNLGNKPKEWERTLPYWLKVEAWTHEHHDCPCVNCCIKSCKFPCCVFRSWKFW